MQDLYCVNPYAAAIPCDLEETAVQPEIVSYLRWRVALPVTWFVMLAGIVTMLQTYRGSILASSGMNLKLTLMSSIALGLLWSGSRGRWRLGMAPICCGIAILTMRVWMV